MSGFPFDNLEEITFVPINTFGMPDESAQIANARAIRGYVNDQTFRTFSTVAIQPSDVPFYVFPDTIPGQVCEPGARIVDAGGNRFNILSVQFDRMTYLCLCRQIRANE